MLRLEAEIDFHHTPHKVALRLFRIDEAGERQILRAQQLYNLASRLKRSTDPEFSEADHRLIRYLSAELSNPVVIKKNLNVLLMDRQPFDRLAARFEDVPNRFVMIGTKQPFGAVATAAAMHFELTCLGKESVLAAMVEMPDGHCKSWSLVRREFLGTKNEALVNGQLVTLDLPIARELLDRVFGADNPRVPTGAIEKHLPVLLNQRLDLLRGPAVRHEQRPGKAKVILRTEGADIRVRPLIGQAMLRGVERQSWSSLVRDGDQFVVIDYAGPEADVLRQFVTEMAADEKADYYLLTARPANVRRLCEAVHRLPAEVEREIAPELQQLFGGPLPVGLDVRAATGAGWFQLDVDARLGELRLGLDELRDLADRADAGIVRTRSGAWLQVDEAGIRNVLSTLVTLDAFERPRRAAAEAREVLAQLQELPNLQWQQSAQALAAAVGRQQDLARLEIPSPLREHLREYQRQGAEFLFNRCGYGVGALLADDMGLGKTVQVLAALTGLKQRGDWRRALVICPASVMTVWRDEAARFCPELQVELLWGGPEQRQDVLTGTSDLLVCTYAVARNDGDLLRQVEWTAVVLDEAQQIKNPGAQVTRAVKRLSANHRLALTGTPLENRLEDLWSIIDFLNPGYFGRQEDFQAVYGGTSWRREALPRRLQPIMLRRTKDEVAPELPPRNEETISVPLEAGQAQFYAQQLQLARTQASEGGTMEVLAALLRLRQTCCHPRLVDERSEASSAKFECLLEMLSEILHEGHSVLVFSQFTSMLEIIATELDARNWHYFTLTGETPVRERQYLVRKFNEAARPSVFLLSLRAAGTGLTLSKADYVFIYDPWWNPAVESQAIDRTHRIGQDKPVMAYRLITAGTVEEKVALQQQQKRELFTATIDAVDTVPENLSAAELRALLG